MVVVAVEVVAAVVVVVVVVGFVLLVLLLLLLWLLLCLIVGVALRAGMRKETAEALVVELIEESDEGGLAVLFGLVGIVDSVLAKVNLVVDDEDEMIVAAAVTGRGRRCDAVVVPMVEDGDGAMLCRERPSEKIAEATRRGLGEAREFLGNGVVRDAGCA